MTCRFASAPHSRNIEGRGPTKLRAEAATSPLASGLARSEHQNAPQTPGRNHLDENLRGANLELTTADLKEIDEAFATIDIKGAPISEVLDASIDR